MLHKANYESLPVFTDKNRVTRFAPRAVVCLLLPLSLIAQRYSFKHYDEDLPNQDVRAFTQDHTGFLWVGTDNGLYRYDGQKFRGYGTAEGLPSPMVQALEVDGDGVLWVATYSGLARLEGDRFQPVDITPARGAVALASDAAGRLYVGTTKGLMVSGPHPGSASKPSFALYTVDGVQQQVVRAITISRDGMAWYACGAGLCRLINGKAVTRPEWSVPQDAWQAVAEDSAGNIWARSRAVIIELRKGDSRFIPPEGDLPPALANGRMLAGAGSELWVPTVRGLAQRTHNGWDIIGKSRGLPVSSVECVFQDREGSLWIGMNGAGLVRWLGYPNWEGWTEAEGLSSEAVWSIRRDTRGTLWSTHNMGVSRFRQDIGRWEDLKMPGIQTGTTTHLTQAPDGSIWAAQPAGAVHIDTARGIATTYGRETGLEDSWVTALAVDSENRVWAGTRRGLYVGSMRNGKMRFERQKLPVAFAEDFVYAILVDSHKRLWVGTWGGLLRLEDGQWIRLTTKDGLLDNRAGHLAENADGSLWVGYNEARGVSQLVLDGRRPSWHHYSTQNGLESDQIFLIGCDRRGWTWLGTDKGLDVFRNGAWNHFDRTDGLLWDDCSGEAFFADSDGSVWLGTSRGISHLRIPAAGLSERSMDATALLTAAAFGDRRVALDRSIDVPWGRRSMDVSFTVPTFANEDSLRFRYRIAGLDSQWIETQARDVHIPSLPAGSYAFEVQAKSTRGDWTGVPAHLGFTIRPAWWRTWWFDFALLGAIAFAARQWWAWRLRGILRRQRELESAVAERTQSLSVEKARAERERDIVETQKVEIERLYREARQASRLKDEFLANMSHELRTPMNGIIGMTELALATQLTPDQADFLRTVRNSSWSLLGVLDDILDLSRIESGELNVSSETFEPRAVVQAAVQGFEGEIHLKGLDLSVEISRDVPKRVVADPLRMRQVLVKTLSNAVKFTDRGRISVKLGLEGGAQGGRLHFEVSDTGIGIPPEQHASIFEPFWQADGSHTRRHGGTGLGLTICSRFVQMMQGRIWVESEPGKGSRFHVVVPYACAAEPASEAVPRVPAGEQRQVAAPISGARMNILLAEDNIVNQKLAVRLLQSRGHKVVAAGNGIEALAAFDRQSFDAVLMDVQMPDMGGFEATAEIRARERKTGARIPIIALTAHAMPGDRERCLDAGMDDYVAKPIRPDELFGALEKAQALLR